MIDNPESNLGHLATSLVVNLKLFVCLFDEVIIRKTDEKRTIYNNKIYLNT